MLDNPRQRLRSRFSPAFTRMADRLGKIAWEVGEPVSQRPRRNPAVSFSPAARRVSSFLAKWKRR